MNFACPWIKVAKPIISIPYAQEGQQGIVPLLDKAEVRFLIYRNPKSIAIPPSLNVPLSTLRSSLC